MKHIIQQIIEIVAEEFGVIPNAIKGRSKIEELSLPRLAAMHLSWRYVGAADRTISYYFNRKNGQCIRYARQTVPTLIQTNKTFANLYKSSESKINL